MVVFSISKSLYLKKTSKVKKKENGKNYATLALMRRDDHLRD